MTPHRSGAIDPVVEEKQVKAVPPAPVKQGPLRFTEFEVELAAKAFVDGPLLVEKGVGIVDLCTRLSQRKRPGKAYGKDKANAEDSARFAR